MSPLRVCVVACEGVSLFHLSVPAMVLGAAGERTGGPHFRPDEKVTTSAGTVAVIDCCLHLLSQRHDADVASRIARLLVTPTHRQGGRSSASRSRFLSCRVRAACLKYWHGHASIRRMPYRWMLSLTDVAHMSRRILARRSALTPNCRFASSSPPSWVLHRSTTDARFFRRRVDLTHKQAGWFDGPAQDLQCDRWARRAAHWLS